ncbi:MAG: hypothetical protein ACO295_05245 [Sediminibacterium sp.]
MGKRSKSKGGGARNSDRNNGKAWKKVKKSPNAGATGRSKGGYSIEKRPDKAAAWDPISKRKARKARRKAAGLAIAHGLRTGQLSKVKANADS